MIKFVRVLAELVLACGLSTAASAQTKWDVPTPYPDGNFHTRNVAMFAVEVAKATNGSLTITVHSAGSLIKHAEIKRAVRQGMQMDLASGVEFETFLVTTIYGTEDKHEGISAFLEKREASFKGR